MKKYVAAFVVTLGLTGGLASGQTNDPTQNSSADSQTRQKVTVGTIRDLDLRPGGSLTLDDGTTLTMPADPAQLEWTSLPEVGQEVQVTYDEGSNVVHSIDPGIQGTK